MNKNVKGLLVLVLILGLGFTGYNSFSKKQKVDVDFEEELNALEMRIEELEGELEKVEEKEVAEEEVAEEAVEEVVTTEVVDANSSVEEKIEALIQEKTEVINKKKLSRNGLEQKELGKKIGEIEREISKLRSGK